MPVRYKVKTSGAKLNLRDIPSASGAVIDKLVNGQELDVVDATRADNWWRVSVKGILGPRIGFLSSAYLEPTVAYDAAMPLEPLVDVMRAVSKAANKGKLSSATSQRVDQLASQLAAQLPAYQMASPLRIAHFLAQAGAETGGFLALAENLNYTTTKALRAAFGNRFDNYNRDPNDYLRNPEKLANFVYANRIGNGDEASGDGYRFRGRGLIQLTGRRNYAECARLTGEPVIDDPDRCAAIDGAVITALKYWNARGLQAFSGPSEMHARWLGAAVNVGWNPAGAAPRPSSHNEELRVSLFNAAIEALAKLAPAPGAAPASPLPAPIPAPAPAEPAPAPAEPAPAQPVPATEAAPASPGATAPAPSAPGSPEQPLTPPAPPAEAAPAAPGPAAAPATDAAAAPAPAPAPDSAPAPNPAPSSPGG